jgi:hypothetical protein
MRKKLNCSVCGKLAWCVFAGKTCYKCRKRGERIRKKKSGLRKKEIEFRKPKVDAMTQAVAEGKPLPWEIEL